MPSVIYHGITDEQLVEMNSIFHRKLTSLNHISHAQGYLTQSQYNETCNVLESWKPMVKHTLKLSYILPLGAVSDFDGVNG